jgi:hypothetical protein
LRSTAAIIISAISVSIALFSFVLNLRLNQRAAIRARKPVLVFVDEPSEGCWVIRNVGNGPALNVLVAQRADGRWFNPVFIPPFGKDGQFPLKWLGRVNVTGLGATYSDFEDRRYTSTLGGERSHTYDGARLPSWDDGEIRRYWELSDQLVAQRWGERVSDFRA